MPLHADGTITLVGQNRFAHANYSWELPEGGAPLDEDLLEGAKRELAEEGGLRGRRLATDPDDGAVQLDHRRDLPRLSLATGPDAGAVAPDETEDLAIVRVPVRRGPRRGGGAATCRTSTVALLLRVHHMAVKGELPAGLARLVLGLSAPFTWRTVSDGSGR